MFRFTLKDVFLQITALAILLGFYSWQISDLEDWPDPHFRRNVFGFMLIVLAAVYLIGGLFDLAKHFWLGRKRRFSAIGLQEPAAHQKIQISNSEKAS